MAPPARRIPRLETKPIGLCPPAAADFFFFSGFHWPSQRLRWLGGGEEYRSLTGKTQSLEPRTPFPRAAVDRWLSFPDSQLQARSEGSRTPAWWWGGRRKCASYPILGESSPAGLDLFPCNYPGSGCFVSSPGEASGRNGRTGLICNEFCPLALGEKILIAGTSERSIFLSYSGAKSGEGGLLMKRVTANCNFCLIFLSCLKTILSFLRDPAVSSHHAGSPTHPNIPAGC